MSGEPPRVLLVTYVWPPTGGAGVGRVLKLAKYLPDHGVQPTVLTVANPSVPLTDASLQRDVPPGMEVVHARSFEPGYKAKSAAWESANPVASISPRKRLLGRLRARPSTGVAA